MEKVTEAHWNEFASDYDSVMGKDVSYLRQLDNIVSQIPLGTREILDIGCGTGALSKRVLDKFPKINLTALDPAEKMLKEMERNFGRGQVRLCKGSADKMPFTDNTFDCLITNWALHHLSHINKGKCAEELFRILNTNGTLILGDQFTEVMSDNITDEKRVKSIFDLLVKRAYYYYENVSFERMVLQVKLMQKFLLEDGECLATIDFWIENLAKAGFKDIEVIKTEPDFLYNRIIVAKKY